MAPTNTALFPTTVPSPAVGGAGGAPSASLVERATEFLTEHKKAILIGAAAAAVAGGVAYALYAPSTSGRKDGEGKKKKKSGSKGSKKNKPTNDKPILEEKKPKVEDSPSGTFTLAYSFLVVHC